MEIVEKEATSSALTRKNSLPKYVSAIVHSFLVGEAQNAAMADPQE